MRMLLTSWIAGSCLALFTCSETVSAGTLMDALINNRRAAYPTAPYQTGVPTQYAPSYAQPMASGTPVTAAYAPVANYANVVSNYGTYASNYAPAVTPANSGYGPIPVGVPQAVPSYLPTAQYDTVWNRTPVTYYRPVTSFDPRLGTTVTSLQPCTGYQYQASRVPMIAPRAVLGEYGLQSNQWPSITGPGYNPAGLAVTANYPGYQTLPNSGAFAPYGNSGTSMGMPASSLPVTTRPASPAVPVNPAMGNYNVTSNYPSSAAPVSSYPAYTAPSTFQPQASSFRQADGSIWTPIPNGQANAPVNQVLPATSYLPAVGNGLNSNCPNGMCPIPNSGMSTAPQYNVPQYNQSAVSSMSNSASLNAPYYPGATTVQPLGQPIYSSVPPSSYSPNNPSGGVNPVLPNNGQNSQTYTPNVPSGMGGVADPESVVQPRFDGANTVQKATTDHLVNSSEPTARSNRPEVSDPPLHGGLLPWNRENSKPTETTPAPVDRSGRLEIPSTLPPKESDRSSYRSNPLRAPEGMDTKALWNPDLLGPNDLEARANDTDRKPGLTPASKQNDAPIQFVSGGSSSRDERKNESLGIYFRQIAPSK